MSRIRLMVVGVGWWGQEWIASLKDHPVYEIVAFVDQSDEQTRIACAKHGLRMDCAFRRVEDAIGRAQPEAALITVPPAAHFDVSMSCLQGGLHVLSEKPLANDMGEALVLLGEARTRGIHFMVSQDYRWQPAVQTVRQMIDEGNIGDVGYVIYRAIQRVRLPGWRELMPDVVLEDMSIHHFDLMRYLLGRDCRRVYSESFNPVWSWYRGGGVAMSELTFEGDIHVAYAATWVTMGGVDQGATGEIRIDGSQGSVVLATTGEIQLHDSGGSKPVAHRAMACEGRAHALNAFREALREGVSLETDITDNIRSFAMVRAALKSSRESRPVNLDELGRSD